MTGEELIAQAVAEMALERWECDITPCGPFLWSLHYRRGLTCLRSDRTAFGTLERAKRVAERKIFRLTRLDAQGATPVVTVRS